MADLTTANSALTLAIDDLYAAPQPIQGYAVDDAFTSEAVSPAETMMGVDGFLSGGYTPYPVPLHITLMANSPSIEIFDNWLQAMGATKSIYRGNASIILPGLGQQWVLSRGILTQAPAIPDAKKILQPRRFTIVFESVTTSSLGG